MVSVDGEEPVSMYIQVPEKELEEQGGRTETE